jgi:hypothetical protein
MSSWKKTREKLLLGASDANIDFGTVCTARRGKGSHRIFYREGIEEIINLQPSGSKGKPYQTRQIRQILFKYRLTEHED